MNLADYVPPTPASLATPHIWLWCGEGGMAGRQALRDGHTSEQHAAANVDHVGDDLHEGRPDVLLLIVAEVAGLITLLGTCDLTHCLFEIPIDSGVLIGKHKVVAAFDLESIPEIYYEDGTYHPDPIIWNPIAVALQCGDFASVEHVVSRIYLA